MEKHKSKIDIAVLILFFNRPKMLEKVAKIYSDSMNIIHYMHDKYAYERLMMSLHDVEPERLMAFGISGLSVLVDSLSAIKYAEVKPIKDERGIIVDFETTGDFPKYGNDNDDVDRIAKWVTEFFYKELCKTKAYRNAKHTLSILTITSNVVYGSKTGATPDGRKSGVPFSPGANPTQGADKNGALAVMNSVAKLPFNSSARDNNSSKLDTDTTFALYCFVPINCFKYHAACVLISTSATCSPFKVINLFV